ncbi:MAG TPA: type IV pilus secretin PilQ [Methylococcaceae bacterium]|nr:type IV pilus secretin PilQ [Methylococcaceae bacterium]HIA45824.1 type IV pilus secretin PilQ [Methylococcaceae bacterium]HIN69527.1 type IV pilus secretin PilQ [Methylococcales bacterium]HIO44416.1 type IV pilus secretin PilQ [Methylococcales bacterium]
MLKTGVLVLKNKRFSFLLLISMLLASCASNEIQKSEDDGIKRGLLNPEQFIEDSKSVIKRNVRLGPDVDLTKQELLKARKRVRINEEMSLNYITHNDESKEYFPISINFDNVGIRDGMRMLAEVTGTNILLGDEVDGVISAQLEEVPWDVALEAILKVKGLAHHVNTSSNITRIHSQEALVAQEDFDTKRLEDLKKSIDAQRAVKPKYTEIYKLYYSDAGTVSSQIQSVLSGQSSGSRTASSSVQATGSQGITIDKRTNSLIVKGTKTELDLISRLIAQIDIRTPQILIEAFIVEATDDFKKELGSRLGYDNADLWENDSNKFGVSGLATGTAGAQSLGATAGAIAENLVVAGVTGGIGGLFTAGANTLKIELNAMELDGFTKILSNPRVYVLNNEEAIIKQGWEIPYKTESESGGTDIEFKDAMLILTVTPSIVGDGNIRLSIKVEKKDADETATNPPLQSEEITTKLMVKDGTVVVIGGVKKQKTTDSTDKVPFFGDLPIIGNLFRHKKDTDKFEELLVFIAPRII